MVKQRALQAWNKMESILFDRLVTHSRCSSVGAPKLDSQYYSPLHMLATVTVGANGQPSLNTSEIPKQRSLNSSEVSEGGL